MTISGQPRSQGISSSRPRVSHLPAPGGGKMRDPGNEVDLGPKLAAILTRPKRSCDVTGGISITDKSKIRGKRSSI